LDLGEDGDAGAPYSSIQKVETAFGQTNSTKHFWF